MKKTESTDWETSPENQKKKRKFGPVKTSICIVAAAAVAAAGTWAGIAFTRPQVRNDVAEDYDSVYIEVKDGEKFDPDSFVSLKARDENDVPLDEEEGTYDAVDIYGRLNYVFKQQENWYSEMHSEVQTAVGIQNVGTYKRYSDGVLISADITTSSLVNDAREFCYIGDRVIWRESSVGKDKWDGMNTAFSDGEPAGNMNIGGEDGFKKKNGLPATELSVYVIKGSTVESAELQPAGAVATADGSELFTVVYHLIAKTDETGATGAAAYYGNQMVFSGGIDAPPTFSYITVSFTFTEDFLPVACEVDEAYTASMKTITSSCSSHSRTEYSYGLPQLEQEVEDIYEEYYKQYADKEATGSSERVLTATDCLAGAFGPLLSGPTALELDLKVGAKKLSGSVYLDLGGALEGDLSSLEVRLKLGDVLGLWVEDGTAYVNYGGVRLSMSVQDLVALVLSSTSDTEAAGSIDTDGLLASLVGGEFTSDDTSARLRSTLALGGTDIGLDFRFALDEEKNISLDRVGGSLTLGGMPVEITAAYAEEGPAALSAAEKSNYADVADAAAYLKDVFTSEAVHADVEYRNSDLGLSVTGALDISYRDGLKLKGDLLLSYADAEKRLKISLDGRTAYIDLDGIKVKATSTEAAVLMMRLFPDVSMEIGSVSVADIVNTLTDQAFASALVSSERNGKIVITADGTKIMQAFGLDFALGDVVLSLAGDSLTVGALGAEISVSRGQAFTLDTEGYADVIPYGLNIYNLFQKGNLRFDLNYANEEAGVSVSGNIVLGLDPVNAAAELDLVYGGSEQFITVTYAENSVYIAVDGIKMKADVNELMGLFERGNDLAASPALSDILQIVFGLDFAKIVTGLENVSDTLQLQIALDELLTSFGFAAEGFELGTASVTVARNTVTLSADGIEVTMGSSDTPPVIAGGLDSYTDLVPAVETVLGLIGNNDIAAQLSYQGEFTLEGEILFNVAALAAQADLTLSYQNIQKNVLVTFVNDGAVYVDVDGLKIKASIDDISSLLGSVMAAPAADLLPLETLLRDLGSLVSVGTTEEGNFNLKLALDDILGAFGVSLGVSLGELDVTVGGGALRILAMDGALTLDIAEGRPFEAETDGYTEVLPYVMSVYEMIQSGHLGLSLTYLNGEGTLGLSGKVQLSLEPVAAKADFTLTCEGTELPFTVLYSEGVAYLSVGGMDLKVNVSEALSTVGRIADVSARGDVSALLGKVLALRFTDLIPALGSSEGTLGMKVALDKLLSEVLGVTDLSLGDADIFITEQAVTLQAAGLEAVMTAGTPFTADGLEKYSDLAPVVETVVSLIENNVLSADIAYTDGTLSVTGTAAFDIAARAARADLTVRYEETEKALSALFVGDVIYLTLDGLKIQASAEEISSLVAALMPAAPTALSPVESLLGDLSSLLTAKTEEGVFKADIGLGEILRAFDISLGEGWENASLAIGEGEISLSVGSILSVRVRKGETFEQNTDGYTSVLPYVLSVLQMIRSGNLQLDISYQNEEYGLAVDGTLTLGLNDIVAVARLGVTYAGVRKDVSVTYTDGNVYLLVDGIKLKAATDGIAALLPESGAGADGANELLGILALDFGEIVPLLESDGDALRIGLALEELLSAFGVRIGAETAEIAIRQNEVRFKAFGAELTLTAARRAPRVLGDLSTYTDVMPTVDFIVSVVKAGVLRATLGYQGPVNVEGVVDFDLKRLNVTADLTVGYGETETAFTVAFVNDDSMLYLTVGGKKILASVDDILALIGKGTNLTADALAPVGTLLEYLDSFVEISTENGSMKAVIALGKLLSAFGVDLGTDVGTLEIVQETDLISLTALGGALSVGLTQGTPFTPETDGFTEVLPYVQGILSMVRDGVIGIDLSYENADLGLALGGSITLDLGAEEPAAAAAFNVVYGQTEKALTLAYFGGKVYLSVDGIKLKADVAQLISLFSPVEGEGQTMDILSKLLTLDLDALFTVGNNGDSLQIGLDVDALLSGLGFGLGVAIGEADITVTKDSVTLAAAGLTATFRKAEKKPALPADTSSYADVYPVIETAMGLFTENDLLGVALSLDLGKLVGISEGDLTLSGDIDIDLSASAAAADLTLTYADQGKTSAKKLNLYLLDGEIYLLVDGLKLKVSAEQLVGLLSAMTQSQSETFLPVEALLEGLGDILAVRPADGLFMATVDLDKLLSAFGTDGLKLGSADLSADGEKFYLSAFGVLSAEIARGNAVSFDANGYIEAVPYIEELLGLLDNESGTLYAEISYEGNGLSVGGGVTVRLSDLALQGELTLQYQGAAVTLTFCYVNGSVYADVVYGYDLNKQSVKICCSAESIMAVVNALLPKGESDGTQSAIELPALLHGLLSADFGKYLSLIETVAEDGNSLSLTIKGSELLKDYAPDFGFDVGTLYLTLRQGGVDLTALGATLSVSAGEELVFPENFDGYVDMNGLFTHVAEIIDAKGLALGAKGGLTLQLGEDNGAQVDVWLENAGITWKDGFAFRGDIVLSAFGSKHTIKVHATDRQVQLAYGSIGATIVYKDLTEIGNAFTAVKTTILNYINDILGTTADKAGEELSSALALAESGETASGLVGAITDFVGGFVTDGHFDLAKLLGGLMIGKSEKGNGISLSYNGVAVDLTCGKDGLSVSLSLTLKTPEEEGAQDARSQNIQLIGEIAASALAGDLAEMPNKEVNYLGKEEFLDLIGYFGSAVDLLKTKDLTLTFTGTVTSSEEKYQNQDQQGEKGVKYVIGASMETHRGNADFFHLEIDGKNFWIDSDVYMHASINIVAQNTADKSLYIDVFILDGVPVNENNEIVTDENGNYKLDEGTKLAQDNQTDFYVTLSQFGPVGSTAGTVQGYNPVKLYAPASEIMTLLSSALPLFGIDVGILNDFMVFKWLTDMDTVEQFKAFGGIVSPLLKGLFGGEEGGKDAEAQPAALDETAEPTEFKLGDYLKTLAFTETQVEEQTVEGLEIELYSESLYGMKGLENVKATLTKTADVVEKTDDGATTYTFGRFKELKLHNIYDKEGVLNTSLDGAIDYGKVEGEEDKDNWAVPSGTYRSFLGADKLLQALAKSATHGENEEGDIISGEETPHHYAVNDYFYIDGKITAKLFGLDIGDFSIKVDIIAISITVDELGKIGVNIRLEYQSANLGAFVAINGDGEVDITIKGGMVYIKRVQKSYYEILKGLLGHPIDARKHTYTNPNDYITLYRAMPIDNFMSDILNQLGFILNFGDQVLELINKNSGNGSTESDKAVDFGKRLDDVLSKYTYTAEVTENGNVTTPAAWDITLNGNALVKGILGKINVTLCEDADGYLHDITVNLTIVTVIEADLSLRWHNPGGVMENGVSDQTNDISDEVSNKEHGMGAMIEKLNAEQGWDNPNTKSRVEGLKFLEAQQGTVTYQYIDWNGKAEPLDGEQSVFLSTGADGNPARTLYSTLIYPGLPDGINDNAPDEQIIRWETSVGDAVAENGVISARPLNRFFEVTFYLDNPVDCDPGRTWQYDEDKGLWYRKVDMEYSSEIKVQGEVIGTVQVPDGDPETNVFRLECSSMLPDYGTREKYFKPDPAITAKGAEFGVEYEGDTIIYRSEIACMADETGGFGGSDEAVAEVTFHEQYDLITPSAAGYTFLGWFMQKDGKWEQVTGPFSFGETPQPTIIVEALWISNLSVEITKAEGTNPIDKGNGWSKQTYYDYTVTVKIDGGTLLGAFASEATVSMKYVFNAYTSGLFGGTNEITQNNYTSYIDTSTGQGNARERDDAQVIITITYTFGDFTHTVTETTTRKWDTV